MHRITLISLVVIVESFFQTAKCQCSGTGLKSGSAFSNDATVGSLVFTTPTNAQTSDGSYASAKSTATILGTSTSEYLKVSGFSFGLPPTAIICGIQVSVIKKASGLNILASVTDNSVNLLVNGVVSDSNFATSTAWGTSASTSVYGSPTNRWGYTTTALSYSSVSDPNFAVLFSAKVKGLAALGTSADVDQIQVNVYYDALLLGIGLESFTALKNNGTSFLSWAVNADNNIKNFIVQRSADMNTWQNIGDVNAEKNQQQYLFNDDNFLDGNNYYRLQLIGLNGGTTYSNISMIGQETDLPLRIFPNPAFDQFTISANNSSHNIILRDEYGRIVKTINVSTPTNRITVPINDLAAGSYFVQIDNSVLKLWKK